MIRPDNPNSEFQFGGINHVALVCSDMEKTVDFYSGVLGMPLIKSLDLPGGMGQHFFFDAGNGDCVAFFWFAGAADRVDRRPPLVVGLPARSEQHHADDPVALQRLFHHLPVARLEDVQREHGAGEEDDVGEWKDRDLADDRHGATQARRAFSPRSPRAEAG